MKLKSQSLGLFFIIAIVVPSVILSLLAFRTVKSEMAYTEKRLRDSLYAEIQHSVSLIDSALVDIQKELSDSLYFYQGGDYEDIFRQWQKSSLLVNSPFLLSASGQIIWPSSEEKLNTKTQSFLSANAPVFEDKKAIPVYQNIAVAYKDDIVREASRETTPEKSIVLTNKAVGNRGISRVISASDNYTKQMAVSQFNQYEPDEQSMVYEKAKQEGQQVESRNVVPQTSFNKIRGARKQKVPSQWVSSLSKFSEITARAEYGIITRFIDDKLNLIFWKKLENDLIAGCKVEDARIKEKIIGILPDLYSSARILTILDEKGEPIIEPVKNKPLSYWKKPYVSVELSEILPRWELSAYLTDPQSVVSQAQMTAYITWILIFILFVSIVSGGMVVLKSLRSQILLAQQKTTFVSNVSHELKTPLTSIRMFAEMLREKRQPDEAKKQRYLEIMVSEIERLTKLINNVLDFSRMESGKKTYELKKLEITALMRDVFDNQKLRFEQNGFKTNFIAPQENIIVNADEEAVNQAVINLLSNAEKYSFDRKEIEIDIALSDKSVLISIKDRGIGIPLAEAKNIFKEFYRVDDSLTAKVKGTGLGLTIACRLIQDQGGELIYLSREGGGSIFQIQLPVIEDRL
ncbi:MAG: HAMP domain-containing sensor histidine kinase [Candidatus Omnitrophota bacterium]